MIRNCFLCTGEIQRSGSNCGSSSLNPEDNCFLLCQILEIPHLGNIVNKFGKISYCPACVNRISSIGRMLEELERLEKTVLDEKYLIEGQLKQNATKLKCSETDSQNSLEQLTVEIATELRSASIQSTLAKIRRKEIGRRKLTNRNRVRIMENVSIAKLAMSTNEKTLEFPSCSLTNLQNDLIPSRHDSSDFNFEIYQPPTIDCAQSLTKENSSWTNLCDIPENEVKIEYVPITTSTFDPLENADLINDFAGRTDYTNTEGFGSGSTENQFSEFEAIGIDDMNILDGVDNSLELLGLPGPSHSKLKPSCRPKKCEECGKVLSTLRNWRNHVLSSHRREYKFTCQLCDYGCQAQSVLEIHMLSHKTDRDFKCDHCHLSFKRKYNLFGHIARSHPEAPKVQMKFCAPPPTPKKCEECGLVLSTQQNWRKHVLLVHRDKFQYKCKFCLFGGHYQSDIDSHMVIHTDEKRFKCHFCQLPFKYKRNMTKHVREKHLSSV